MTNTCIIVSIGCLSGAASGLKTKQCLEKGKRSKSQCGEMLWWLIPAWSLLLLTFWCWQLVETNKRLQKAKLAIFHKKIVMTNTCVAVSIAVSLVLLEVWKPSNTWKKAKGARVDVARCCDNQYLHGHCPCCLFGADNLLKQTNNCKGKSGSLPQNRRLWWLISAMSLALAVSSVLLEG